MSDTENQITFPKLYKMDSKGKTRVWFVESLGTKYRVCSGVNDGNLVRANWTEGVEKNVGKKNETSSSDQVSSEIESLYKKKKKTGYTENIENISQKKFQCTLAKNYNDYKDKIDLSSGDWVAQTKFNGSRCFLTKDGAFSRKWERILTIPHIIEEYVGFFKSYPDAVVDGELFNFELRANLNELMKLTRRTVHISESDLADSRKMVQFHVYDGFLNEEDSANTYEYRYQNIGSVVQRLEYSFKVPSSNIKSKDELMDFYSSQLSDGQEGVILRNINSEYERKRSKNLLKFKPVDDDEGIIVAVHEGKGNWANTAKTATLKWKDIEFDPVFLGTVEELKDILIDKESYIGRLVKFKFNGLTGLGVPNFARIDLKNSNPKK